MERADCDFFFKSDFYFTLFYIVNKEKKNIKK